MAKKVGDDFLGDARDEHRKQSAGARDRAEGEAGSAGAVNALAAQQPPGTGQGAQAVKETVGHTGTGSAENTAGASGGAGQVGAGQQGPGTGPAYEPPRDEFKERFEEYFKGQPVSGAIAVELVDDLKSSLLLIYAKKSGLDIPKEALAMNQKSKDLCAFLADYAIQNRLFDWIKKYPLAAAGCVVGISGLSSWLMIEMLKKNKDAAKQAQEENERLKKELDDLKARSRQAQYENAETVHAEEVKEPAPAGAGLGLNGQAQNIGDFIKAV